MKFHTLAVALLLEFFFCCVYGQNIRAIYLFKDVMVSNTTAIATSGFNSLIMFGVGILPNGDIMYYSNTAGSKDVLVASGGAYTGGNALAQKVRSFKTLSGSTVNRIEICMNSVNMRELMASPGPSSSTNIYRNFAALKAAWNLDAVNNNDEALYHVPSTVTFAKMIGAIGYKYTLCPYTNINFWTSLRSQVNTGGSQLIDRAYLQCYDGGAGNNPASWQTQLGMRVVPLVWVTNDAKPVYGQTAAQARAKFNSWKAQATLAGGGYWNEYDIEKMGLSYPDYSKVLNDLFP
jgi:hypothetical protein